MSVCTPLSTHINLQVMSLSIDTHQASFRSGARHKPASSHLCSLLAFLGLHDELQVSRAECGALTGPPLGGHGLFGHSGRDGGTSLSRFPLSKLKLDNFFLLWLAVPESQKLVRLPGSEAGAHTTCCAVGTGAEAPVSLRAQVLSLLENAKLGHPLPGPMGSFSLPSLAATLSQVGRHRLKAS